MTRSDREQLTRYADDIEVLSLAAERYCRSCEPADETSKKARYYQAKFRRLRNTAAQLSKQLQKGK